MSGVAGLDWRGLLSLWTVVRCLATDLSSNNFPHTGQAAFLVPGVGEGGAVSDGVGRQDGGEAELGPALSLRQLRVLLTGSVLTARIARRVRGTAGVNISHLDCFSVDLRATAVLLVLGLTGVLTLGVSLK